ncbi:MAG: hypothetical protein IJ761_00270 [Bacteroidales bacterium]|nr:hypothetical protein [Bacteroidales bacterium]
MSNATLLTQQLADARKALAAYEDILLAQIDDDAYIARGNGFCDHKYSDDFIDMQLQRLTQRISDLENQLQQK